jgi:hypothetical protein
VRACAAGRRRRCAATLPRSEMSAPLSARAGTARGGGGAYFVSLNSFFCFFFRRSSPTIVAKRGKTVFLPFFRKIFWLFSI